MLRLQANAGRDFFSVPSPDRLTRKNQVVPTAQDVKGSSSLPLSSVVADRVTGSRSAADTSRRWREATCRYAAAGLAQRLYQCCLGVFGTLVGESNRI